MTAQPVNPDEQRHRAFTKLWLDSQHALGGYVRLQVNDQSTANDIIQEVAAQAAIHFDRYDPTRPFTAWVFGIARQRIAQWYREQNRSPVMFSSATVDMLLPALSSLKAQPNERVDALRDCMTKLTDKQTQLIDMRYKQQLSSQNIAQTIGSSASSINVMLFRIRDALRRCIEQRLEGQQ